MARKRGYVERQPGHINAIDPEIWDNFEGDDPKPGEERENDSGKHFFNPNPRYYRATVREQKFLAVMGGILELSDRIAGNFITVREAAMILGVRYQVSLGSWTVSPLSTDYVRKRAKEGVITKIGHNKYGKQSVTDWAVLTALSKRRLLDEYLHHHHPLTLRLTTPAMSSV